jgi:hypothetical protein
MLAASALVRHVVVLVALAIPAAANGVRILRASGGPSYPSIQAAVDAAVEGEILLAARGEGYAGFTIDGKSVTIVSDPNGFTSCGPIFVRNLAASQRVVLVGLAATGTDYAALWLEDNAGEVRLQFCTFTSSVHPGGTSGTQTGRPAVRIDASDRVVASHSSFIGADGASSFSIGAGGGGGRALHAQEGARIAMHACELRGGNGGDGFDWGGPGGYAFFSSGSFTFASRCEFRPGSAGSTIGGTGACAGAALWQTSGVVHRVACTFLGGTSTGFSCPTNGMPLVGGGATITTHAYVPTVAFAHAVAEAGVALPVTVEGAPGDVVHVAWSLGTGFVYVPSFEGVRLLPFPLLSSTTPLGTIPGSGVLETQVRAPHPGAAGAARVVFAQPVAVGASGARFGNPFQIIVIDRASAPDCDGDGTSDYLDAIEDHAGDANANLVPDVCPGG